jgi:hypothetical protein
MFSGRLSGTLTKATDTEISIVAPLLFGTGSNDLESLLGSDIRINSIGDFFLKNQGLSPIGSGAASITILASNREPQNRNFLAAEMSDQARN